MKTALVTGGGGFVGSALVHRLVTNGVAVRVIGRSATPYPALEGLDVEQIEGDISDISLCKRALKRCDALFHFAADYRLWVPDPKTMYTTNVEATKQLMLTAADSGCSGIVHCSSVATLNCGNDGSVVDENTPLKPEAIVGHYKRSKFLAEQVVVSIAKEKAAPIVIVNPSAPVGPRDCRPTPTGKMVLDAFCGRMPAYIKTGMNLVHVDDVAQGTLLALTHGKYGERYILGGENLMLADILSIISSFSGRPPPRICLPEAPLFPVALLLEACGRLFRFEPLIHRDVLRMARKIMFVSSAKAQRELGYAPRPVIHALADAVRWFHDNGYCSPHCEEPINLPADSDQMLPDGLPAHYQHSLR